MKKLFAAASYSFDNFYNSLNTQGQMIFSIIIFLIIVLCGLLFFTYVLEEIKAKVNFLRIKKETKENVTKENKKQELISSNEEVNDLNKLDEVKNAINDALNDTSIINLTDFEDDQEKTAIISIDELMQKKNDLKPYEDDDNLGINYLEKYNLEPSEVKAQDQNVNNNAEVKAFKVSQVISPIYGIKKEAINGNDNKA